MTTQCLQIDLIGLDFQSPEHLIDSVVDDYVKQMVRGEKLKPVLVCFDGKRYGGCSSLEAQGDQCRSDRGYDRTDGSRISANAPGD